MSSTGAGGAGTPPPAGAAGLALEPWLREILRCPACGSELRDGSGPGGADAAPTPELQCVSQECGLAYRVDGGVPVLLVEEARATKP